MPGEIGEGRGTSKRNQMVKTERKNGKKARMTRSLVCIKKKRDVEKGGADNRHSTILLQAKTNFKRKKPDKKADAVSSKGKLGS